MQVIPHINAHSHFFGETYWERKHICEPNPFFVWSSYIYLWINYFISGMFTPFISETTIHPYSCPFPRSFTYSSELFTKDRKAKKTNFELCMKGPSFRTQLTFKIVYKKCILKWNHRPLFTLLVSKLLTTNVQTVQSPNTCWSFT